MTAAADTVLEAMLRRDRQVVVAALVAVIVMAWIWILLGAGTGMSAIDMLLEPGAKGIAGMMAPAAWTLGYAGIMFTMWWVMMAAMMLPSAAPILLLFARITRKEKSAGRPFIPTGIFAAGYLVAWGGFSALATGLQWSLERLGLLSPMMVTISYWLGGAILLAAGVWQLTPIKTICLRHCRSPIGFLVQSWRPGRGGAFQMGLEHGSFCLGCCWFLMGLLFFWRHHEPVLDYRSGRVRPAREDRADGFMDWAERRGCYRGLGRIATCHHDAYDRRPQRLSF